MAVGTYIIITIIIIIIITRAAPYYVLIFECILTQIDVCATTTRVRQKLTHDGVGELNPTGFAPQKRFYIFENFPDIFIILSTRR